MADDYGMAMGLLGGLKEGLMGYQDARRARESRMIDMASKGLIEQDGKFVDDPAFLAKQRQKIMQEAKLKAGLEGQNVEFDDSGNISNMSYRPDYIEMKKKIAEIEAGKDPFGLKAASADKARREADDDAFKKTPQGKIQNLSGEARSRFDNVTGSMQALEDIKGAYGSKKRDGLLGNIDMMQIPLRGDTPYTEATNRFEEFLGRMQSGGQISKQEKESFAKLRPKPNDSTQVANIKLQKMEQILQSRLQSFGLKPDDAVSAGLLKRGANPVAEGQMNNPLQPGANAAGGFPRQIKKGNQIATVSDEKELAEAMAEGWQ